MLLSKTSLSFRVYIPLLPGSEHWTAVFHEWMSSFISSILLQMSRISKNNSWIFLYKLLSHHSLSFQKKNPLPKPSWKAMSEMFCSPSKLIRLSVEHEPSANTHPAVISTLSHFAFVKFCIPIWVRALLWLGNDVQNSNLFLRLCAGGRGWLALK